MADMVPNTPSTPTGMLVNGAKALGEVAVIPGISQIVDGNVKSGVLHAAVAFAAVWVLGPIGPLVWVASAVDSYSQSVTGNGLRDQFRRTV